MSKLERVSKLSELEKDCTSAHLLHTIFSISYRNLSFHAFCMFTGSYIVQCPTQRKIRQDFHLRMCDTKSMEESEVEEAGYHIYVII